MLFRSRIHAHDLRRFADELDQHFSGEEQEGSVFSTLRDVLPHRAADADALLREHDVMRGNLRRLADTLDEMCALFDATANLLREHERREAQLLLEAFFQDLGGES